jgi:hypothetical protein
LSIWDFGGVKKYFLSILLIIVVVIVKVKEVAAGRGVVVVVVVNVGGDGKRTAHTDEGRGGEGPTGHGGCNRVHC